MSPRRDGLSIAPPDEAPSARPGEVRAGTPASPGPTCWQCGRYFVDTDGDFCDDCLDRVADELEARGVAW